MLNYVNTNDSCNSRELSNKHNKIFKDNKDNMDISYQDKNLASKLPESSLLKQNNKSEYQILKLFKILSLEEKLKQAIEILPSNLKQFVKLNNIDSSKNNQTQNDISTITYNTNVSNNNNISEISSFNINNAQYNKSKSRTRQSTSQIKSRKSKLNNKPKSFIISEFNDKNKKEDYEFYLTERNYLKELNREKEAMLIALTNKQNELKRKIVSLNNEIGEIKESSGIKNHYKKDKLDDYINSFSNAEGLVNSMFKYECKSKECLARYGKYILMRLEYDDYIYRNMSG